MPRVAATVERSELQAFNLLLLSYLSLSYLIADVLHDYRELLLLTQNALVDELSLRCVNNLATLLIAAAHRSPFAPQSVLQKIYNQLN